MHKITLTSTWSLQGSFFLQNIRNEFKDSFFREREIRSKRILNNYLIDTDILCFTLSEFDSICDVIDFCGYILKILPNTNIKEILVNDTLIQGRADQMDYYIEEVNELFKVSGLPVYRFSRFSKYAWNESDFVSYADVSLIKSYLNEIFLMRHLNKFSRNARKTSFGAKKINTNGISNN